MKLDVEALFQRGGSRLAASLSAVRGINMENGHWGTLSVNGAVGDVRVEPNGWIVMSVETKPPATAAHALRTNRSFPGTVRYTRHGSGTSVMADTMVDGEAHLPATLKSLVRGVKRAHRGRTQEVGEEPSREVADRVSAAIDELGWNDDAVVELDQGWELRPRVGEHVRPVQVRAEADGARLTHTVVSHVTEAVTETVCDFALRANARVRLARFVLREDALVAETRLVGELAGQARWIEQAALAVASAAAVAMPVRLLADEQQPRVAHWYAAMSSTSQR